MSPNNPDPGMTAWDILLRFVSSRTGKITVAALALVLIIAFLSGWLRVTYGPDGLRASVGRPIPRSDMERFVGRWNWTGKNLVPDKPYEYAGALTLRISGDQVVGEGEYRITAGVPEGSTPPRSIEVVGRPDGEYLNINYEVRAVGVPGSRGFGFMILYAKPNATQMDGHFLTRSLRDDGFVWGEVHMIR
jgi:hypothetical protein